MREGIIPDESSGTASYDDHLSVNNSDDVSSCDESILSEEAIGDHFPEIDKVYEGLCWSYEEKLSRLSNELKKVQDALIKERGKREVMTHIVSGFSELRKKLTVGKKSPGFYQCIRKSKLIKLPCRTNL